jgi:hypothetical protein
LIIHQLNKFASGTKETLMMTILKKDDLFLRMETASTPII